MKKLLCINAKLIVFSNIRCHGGGLKEGEIYETKGKPFIDEYGHENYYIKGLGVKLCCRFTELLEDREEQSAEKALEKLKEEFQLN